MSANWDPYVRQMLDSKAVNHASIHRFDGTPLAASAGFDVSREQAAALAEAISGDAFSVLEAMKFHLAGNQFSVLQVNPGASISGSSSNLEQSRAVIAKSQTCIIIGTCSRDQQPAALHQTVAGIAEYLTSLGD